MYYLKCKKIETAIRRAKKRLLQSPCLYENFGQTEIRLIKDKFISFNDDNQISKQRQLDIFDKWCSTLTDSQFRKKSMKL